MKLIYKYNICLDKKQSKIIMELIKYNNRLYKKVYNENINNQSVCYEELFDKYKNDESTKKLDYSIAKGCFKYAINNLIKKEKILLVPLVFEKEGINIEHDVLKLKVNRNIQIRYNINNLKIKLSNRDMITDNKTYSNTNIKNNFSQIDNVVVMVKNSNQFIIILKYIDKKISKEDSNIVAIDLGVSNLAACTNLQTEETILINGGPLKAMNRYVNNKIAKLQMMEFKRLRANYKKDGKAIELNQELVDTKQIRKLQTYRKNYIKTYMQKSANEIIKYAIKNKANTIVIGYVRDIKQNNRYTENFIPVPIQELEKELWRKGKKNNIIIRKVSESYTSGVSSLDLELINKINYNKNRRIVRGLFKTNNGIYINSDINGSLNILRKFVDKEEIIKRYKSSYIKPVPQIIIKSVKQGYIRNPYKINIV